jgi:hypothetical protein
MVTNCAPCWARPCPGCGGLPAYRWQRIADGRRQIRASCERCGRWLGFAPVRTPYTAEADTAEREEELTRRGFLPQGDGAV